MFLTFRTYHILPCERQKQALAIILIQLNATEDETAEIQGTVVEDETTQIQVTEAEEETAEIQVNEDEATSVNPSLNRVVSSNGD
jgi:hypothetical protein